MDYFISMATSIIIASVKNKKNKKELKAIMLKIYNTIKKAYIGDKDFE